MTYRLLSPSSLLATEEVCPHRVAALEREILACGCWTVPVSAERRALFVMDGHHRLMVAQRLGLKRIPVALLDYSMVRVEAWRAGETITPQCIFAMAQSGRKFPLKTTRHIFGCHLSCCCVPLSELLHGEPQTTDKDTPLSA